MKSWEKRNNPVWTNLDRKKWARKLRLSQKSTPAGKHKDKHYGSKVIAPEFIDVYKIKYMEPFLEFLDELLRLSLICAQNNRKLTICFRNTFFVSASAALLLLSRVETIKMNNPNLNLSLTRPPKWLPKRGKFHTPQLSTVGQVFNRIGLYEALGLGKMKMSEVANVKCWEVIRGQSVNAPEAGKMLQEIQTKLNVNVRQLYRPLIEAMSNAVEHAYPIDTDEKRWWMFASVSDVNGGLTVLICDNGVGIPNTLEITQSETMLNTIMKKLGIQLDSDEAYIKASLEVRQTRTELGHRGKGGGDMKSTIAKTEGSSLLILSNRGRYRYGIKKLNRGIKKEFEVTSPIPRSINGTLVEWTVPLKVI